MCVVAKCIDQYVKKRVHNDDCDASEFEPIDARLEAIVEQMFSRCFEDKQIKQVYTTSSTQHHLHLISSMQHLFPSHQCLLPVMESDFCRQQHWGPKTVRSQDSEVQRQKREIFSDIFRSKISTQKTRLWPSYNCECIKVPKSLQLRSFRDRKVDLL